MEEERSKTKNPLLLWKNTCSFVSLIRNQVATCLTTPVPPRMIQQQRNWPRRKRPRLSSPLVPSTHKETERKSPPPIGSRRCHFVGLCKRCWQGWNVRIYWHLDTAMDFSACPPMSQHLGQLGRSHGAMILQIWGCGSSDLKEAAVAAYEFLGVVMRPVPRDPTLRFQG